jgi:galactokinase/predicted dehydrogenase
MKNNINQKTVAAAIAICFFIAPLEALAHYALRPPAAAEKAAKGPAVHKWAEYFSLDDPSGLIRLFRQAKERKETVPPEIIKKVRADNQLVRRRNPQDALKIMDELMLITKGRGDSGALRAMEEAGLGVGEIINRITIIPEVPDEAKVDPKKRTPPHGKSYDISTLGNKAVFVLGAGDMGAKYMAAMPLLEERFGGLLNCIGYVQIEEPARALKVQKLNKLFRDVNGNEPKLPRDFKSIDEIIEEAKRQGYAPEDIVAIIATPDTAHFKNIEELAALGIKRMLVEKPVAFAPSELRKVIEMRDAKGLEIVGQSQYRFSETLARLKEVIQKRKFKPRYIIQNWTKDRTADSLDGRNMRKLHFLGDELIEDVPHILFFDSIHQLAVLGALAEVSGVQYAFASDMVVPAAKRTIPMHGSGGIILTHKKGLRGSVITDCMTRPGQNNPKQKAINLLGEDGSVIVAEVGADAYHLGTIRYIEPDGNCVPVSKPLVINENSEDIVAAASAELISDLLYNNSRLSKNSLESHLENETLIAKAVEMTERQALDRPKQPAEGKFRTTQEWLNIVRDEGNKGFNLLLKQIYGNRPGLIKERRAKIVSLLEESARRLGPDRQVCIVRAPARINLCGRGNQDGEDGNLNYLTEARENFMVVAVRPGDDTANFYNITPAFMKQEVSFNIRQEINRSPRAWNTGWMEYLNDDAVKAAVAEARADNTKEWVNVPRGAILNLVHEMVFKKTLFIGPDTNGFDAVMYSDIPPGGGISSSSALAVNSVLAFLTANNIDISDPAVRSAIAMLPYEIYTGELGGNGDHAAIMLGRLNSITHLSQMNSTGRPNQVYAAFPDELSVAVVPSFVSARKTAEQRVENNKNKFAFKLAVPVIKKVLKGLKRDYPEITDAFINDFRYIGQLVGRDEAGQPFLGKRYEEIVYQVLKGLPEEKTVEQLMGEYPYSGHGLLAKKFGLTEADLDAAITGGKKITKIVNLKGSVMFFLAMSERARMFGDYMVEAQTIQRQGDGTKRLDELFRRAGELMYIGHDGDRVKTYRPAKDNTVDYKGTPVTNRLLDKLILDIKTSNPAAKLYRQAGYFRASIEELDTIVDIAKSLGPDVVLGAAVTGAGFGGNVVVLMKKKNGKDQTAILRQALSKARVLRRSREAYAKRFNIDVESLAFASADIPIAGASALELPLPTPLYRLGNFHLRQTLRHSWWIRHDMNRERVRLRRRIANCPLSQV